MEAEDDDSCAVAEVKAMPEIPPLSWLGVFPCRLDDEPKRPNITYKKPTCSKGAKKDDKSFASAATGSRDFMNEGDDHGKDDIFYAQTWG